MAVSAGLLVGHDTRTDDADTPGLDRTADYLLGS